MVIKAVFINLRFFCIVRAKIMKASKNRIIMRKITFIFLLGGLSFLQMFAQNKMICDNAVETNWDSALRNVEIPSVKDGTIRRALMYKTICKSPQPLVVNLDTWNNDSVQKNPLIKEIIARGWNYIHPNLEEVNQEVSVVSILEMLAHIEDAIRYALRQTNANPNDVHIIGSGKGGVATLASYMNLNYPGMNGYIVKGIGGFYYVKTPDGIVECKPRGIFRKQKITPVAGDEVTLETENGASVIAQIAPRKNVFVRPPVANLDVLFLVASTTQPTPSTLVLDKLSAIAVDKGVQPVIVCTKGDLAEAEFLRSAYEKSTLPFIRIDYGSGAGLDEVKQWISGRLCAFCGNSGVGKSTLLNALLPDAARETSAISQKLGRGRHTTREVTIFEAFGGRIADTPGFASLEANRAGFIPKENLEHAFPEFGPYLGQCQFTGCSHRTEKGCAVRQALAEGKLSQTRYDSYCAMYDEVKDVKDWQRPKF